MATKRHKIGDGVLTLDTAGAVDMSAQVTNCVLTPTTEKEDDLTVLSGDVLPGAETTTWEIAGTAFADDDADGFVEFCFDNAGTQVPFEFSPNSISSAAYSGTLTVRPLPAGGEVGAQHTVEFTFPVVGTPTRTPPPVTEP